MKKNPKTIKQKRRLKKSYPDAIFDYFESGIGSSNPKLGLYRVAFLHGRLVGVTEQQREDLFNEFASFNINFGSFLEKNNLLIMEQSDEAKSKDLIRTTMFG